MSKEQNRKMFEVRGVVGWCGRFYRPGASQLNRICTVSRYQTIEELTRLQDWIHSQKSLSSSPLNLRMSDVDLSFELRVHGRNLNLVTGT